MWLIFKGGVSTIAMGNTLLVRPSDSTPLIGLAMEELFIKAGFDNFEYQNVFSSIEQID